MLRIEPEISNGAFKRDNRVSEKDHHEFRSSGAEIQTITDF